MKLNSLNLLTAAVLVLAGCSSAPINSSTPIKVDAGPIHASTFNFVSRRPQSEPAIGNLRADVHEMTQSAITKDLAACGISRVASDGNITVGYFIIISDNGSVDGLTDYSIEGESLDELVKKTRDTGAGGSSTNSFEATTLVIDIIDTKTSKLLKRNYTTRAAVDFIAKEARAKRIQEMVDEVFKAMNLKPENN